MLTLDWLWGCPQTLIQRRHISSVHVGLANGCLLQTGGTYNQSCMCPTNSAGLAFLIFLNQYLSIFVRGSLYPQQKCAYSALHLQALTECSPLNFQRLSIVKRNLVNYHLIMAGPSPDTMSYFTHQYFSLQPKHLHLFFHSLFQFCQCVIGVFIFTVLLTYCLGERKKKKVLAHQIQMLQIPTVEKAAT